MSLFNHVTVDDPRWEVMFVELEDEEERGEGQQRRHHGSSSSCLIVD